MLELLILNLFAALLTVYSLKLDLHVKLLKLVNVPQRANVLVKMEELSAKQENKRKMEPHVEESFTQKFAKVENVSPHKFKMLFFLKEVEF